MTPVRYYKPELDLLRLCAFLFVFFTHRIEELASFSKMLGLYNWRNDVGFIIAFAATVIISLLSYRFFEKPFLQLKRRFTFIPSRD